MAFFGFTKLTSGCLTYWHRPPTPAASGSDQPPVVFCHGLGVGVISYITVVQSLVCKGPGRRLIMVELPHISMRPVETQASPRELVASIADMLAAHACLPVGAHFVGHSFGSVVCAWVARQAPHLACRMTFLDPVCFLLCKHDVVRSCVWFPSR